jgi:hypothetical protein
MYSAPLVQSIFLEILISSQNSNSLKRLTGTVLVKNLNIYLVSRVVFFVIIVDEVTFRLIWDIRLFFMRCLEASFFL